MQFLLVGFGFSLVKMAGENFRYFYTVEANSSQELHVTSGTKEKQKQLLKNGNFLGIFHDKSNNQQKTFSTDYKLHLKLKRAQSRLNVLKSLA